jgi:hypothetical protein
MYLIAEGARPPLCPLHRLRTVHRAAFRIRDGRQAARYTQEDSHGDS